MSAVSVKYNQTERGYVVSNETGHVVSLPDAFLQTSAVLAQLGRESIKAKLGQAFEDANSNNIKALVALGLIEAEQWPDRQPLISVETVNDPDPNAEVPVIAHQIILKNGGQPGTLHLLKECVGTDKQQIASEVCAHSARLGVPAIF